MSLRDRVTMFRIQHTFSVWRSIVAVLLSASLVSVVAGVVSFVGVCAGVSGHWSAWLAFSVVMTFAYVLTAISVHMHANATEPTGLMGVVCTLNILDIAFITCCGIEAALRMDSGLMLLCIGMLIFTVVLEALVIAINCVFKD